MKTAFALVLTLALPLSALAAPVGWKDAASCVIPPDHGVWNNENTVLIGCITDEAWQAAAQEAQTRNGARLPVFAAGGSITDEHGIPYACPFNAIGGCYDLTRTNAYRNAMLQAARDLIAHGYTAHTAGPMAGWIAAVR